MSKIGPELPEAVWRLEPKIIDWEPNTFATDIDQRRGPLRQRLGTMVDLSVLRLLSTAESSWNTPTSSLRWPTAAAKTPTCQATVVQSTCSVAGRSMEPGSVLWWVQVHPREIRWTCSRLPSFRWMLHWRLCQTDWQIPRRIGYGVGWHKQQQENKLGHY